MPGNIKEAIGNGKVEKALSLLEDYLKTAKPALLDDALLVKSKYFKAKEDFELRSISSREEFERTNAQTIMGIQELLKKAEQNAPIYGAVAMGSSVPSSPSSSRRWIFIAALGMVLAVAAVFVISKLNKKPPVTKATTIYYFEDSNPFEKKGKVSSDEKEEKLTDMVELSLTKFWRVELRVPNEYRNAPVYLKNNQKAIVANRLGNKIVIAIPKEFKISRIQLGKGSKACIKETRITKQNTVLEFNC